ncbi:AAT family amino acid transporter [Sporormia fimetaria CBS 119925]|uniref:AAT family amino acid transporter n=1 Tax=Sporormia fimetaria CBS 119925 TaxID=1340428 RepID=A0A6A6VQ42_9PLEO|nr:AAT family amino acid transporter [Sporormia fimetaria CBS 119925]
MAPNDLEKAVSGGSRTTGSDFGSAKVTKTGSAWSRFKHSFKRNPNARVVTVALDEEGRPLPDQPVATDQPLAMKLKDRHLQMIAIGGSIGTGLFVGSGAALSAGGPASVVIAYVLIGTMVFCTVHALGELAVTFPVAGSFAVYGTRFIDPAWGFAMAWNYALAWLVALPLEIVAASITMSFWEGSRDVNRTVWVTIFFITIAAINLFGVKGYGEAEFVFSTLKVAAVIGFIILGIVINTGGVPGQPYIGAKFWYNPGAFHNGFKGLCSVFVTAAFSFAGTELVGLCAAETKDPRKTLPKAVKQVFWRITLFYVVSLTIVGCLVPYNDPHLIGASSTDVNASPFVIAVRNAGIDAVPSIMNAVILVAVLSVGNSAVYGSSRTLASLADRKQAPKILGYIDNSGRPLVAILFCCSFGLIAYIVAAGDETRIKAFTWMLAISGLSAIFNWASICLCHIRFRRAWKLQGHTLDDLAFRSQATVYGSWLGLIFNVLILAAQFWTGFAPVGYGEMTAGERVESFFAAYLAFPVLMTSFLAYKIAFKTKFKRLKDIDVVSGRRELDLPALLAAEREEQRKWPRWKKIYKTLC